MNGSILTAKAEAPTKFIPLNEITQYQYSGKILQRIGFKISKNRRLLLILKKVCLLAENHVIILLYAYGGFIPSEFQRVKIHTIDNFTKLIIKIEDRKDLLLQCLENLG
jgi:hypothetical protein